MWKSRYIKPCLKWCMLLMTIANLWLLLTLLSCVNYGKEKATVHSPRPLPACYSLLRIQNIRNPTGKHFAREYFLNDRDSSSVAQSRPCLPHCQKIWLCSKGTTKGQTSLRIGIVWSVPFLIALWESILSVNEKLPVSKCQYFRKYIIQLFGFCYIHVSGQWQAGLER